MSLLLHQRDLTEHKAGRRYSSTGLSWRNISTTFTVPLNVWLKCYLQLGNNRLYIKKKASGFWLAKEWVAVALYEENESIKKILLAVSEEMFLFVCNFRHCNFPIKHFDQQTNISDCPLNQNQNAWTSVIFLSWSISVLGPELCSTWDFEMFMSFSLSFSQLLSFSSCKHYVWQRCGDPQKEASAELPTRVPSTRSWK